MWGDDKVNQKIKSWSKDTAGHTCHDIPISSYCAKGTCLRRNMVLEVIEKVVGLRYQV